MLYDIAAKTKQIILKQPSGAWNFIIIIILQYLEYLIYDNYIIDTN